MNATGSGLDRVRSHAIVAGRFWQELGPGMILSSPETRPRARKNA